MKVILPIAPPAYSQQVIQRANFEIAKAFEQADARYLSQEGGTISGDVTVSGELTVTGELDLTKGDSNTAPSVIRMNRNSGANFVFIPDGGLFQVGEDASTPWATVSDRQSIVDINASGNGLHVVTREKGDARYVRSASAPASAAAAGTAGQIAYDADYIYVCVSSGVWKRAALSTW